jgi:hypothetical protein
MPSEVVYGVIAAINVSACHYVTEWPWRGLKRTAGLNEIGPIWY